MKNTAKKVTIVIVSVFALAFAFGFGSLSNQSELKSLNGSINAKNVKIENLTTDLENQNKNVDNIKKESTKIVNQEKDKNSELTKQIDSLKVEKDSLNNELNEAYEEIKADTKELDRLNSLVSQQAQTAPQEQQPVETAPQVENTAKEEETQAEAAQTVQTVEKPQNDEFETLLNNFTNEMTKLDNSDYAMKSGLNTQEYQNSLLSSIENKGLTDSEKAQLKIMIGGLVETFDNILRGTF